MSNIIHISYFDEKGLPGERKTKNIQLNTKQTAEEICLLISSDLCIRPLTFHLFGLLQCHRKHASFGHDATSSQGRSYTYLQNTDCGGRGGSTGAGVGGRDSVYSPLTPKPTWIAPNTVFSEADMDFTFEFRMRFMPLDIMGMAKRDPSAFCYLYLQCRADLCSPDVRRCSHCSSWCHTSSSTSSSSATSNPAGPHSSREVGQETMLGLGVIDMLCYARLMNLSLDAAFKQLKMKHFIPLATKQKFQLPWDKQRLKLNMRNELRNQWKLYEHESLCKLRKIYVVGFLDCTPAYLCEYFRVHDDNETKDELGDSYIIADLQADRPGLYIRSFAPYTFTCRMKDDNKGRLLCYIDDLQSVQLIEEFLQCMLIIKNSVPCHLRFQCKSSVISFVVLVSSAYRLAVNFHETLCHSVESPTMAFLRKIKAHGPVDKIWAVNRLKSRQKRFASFNYIVKQKSSDLNSFVFIYITNSKSRPQLITVIRDEEGMYQLNHTGSSSLKSSSSLNRSRSISISRSDNELNSAMTEMSDISSTSGVSVLHSLGKDMDSETPRFHNMLSLIQYYTMMDNPAMELHSCVPPEEPCDPSLILLGKRCLDDQVDGDELKSRGRNAIKCSQNARDKQLANNRVTIVSTVDTLSFVGEGRYTEVAKGRLHDRINDVAVKRIKKHLKRDQNTDSKLQFLMNSIHTASFWSHSSIVRIYSISLSPQFSACMEYCCHGSLDVYLRNHSEINQERLSISELVMVCESIAQALHYISETSMTGCTDVHGAIRTRNVLVYGDSQPSANAAGITSSSRSGAPIVKLADAGLAGYYNSLPLYDAEENIERFAWIAPENYDDLSLITTYSDVYSFGVFIWEVFSFGQRPFDKLDPLQIKTQVMRNCILNKPDMCPECLYHLMARCCNYSPAYRPTTHAVIKELFKALSEVNDRCQYTTPSWEANLQSTSHESTGTLMCASDNKASVTMTSVSRSGSVDLAGQGDQFPCVDDFSDDLGDYSSSSDADERQEHGAEGDMAARFSCLEGGRGGVTNLGRTTSQLDQAVANGVDSRGAENEAVAAVSGQSGCSWSTVDSLAPLIKSNENVNSESKKISNFDGELSIFSSEYSNDKNNISEDRLNSTTSSMQSRPLPNVPSRATSVAKANMRGPELRPWQVRNTLKKLGKGYYGVVFKGEYRKHPKGRIRPIAIKCLHAKMYEENASSFEHEIKVMLSLKHDNIVQIIGYMPQRSTTHPMQLILEYFENGSLCQYIKLLKPKGKIDDVSNHLLPTMLRYCREIAAGSHYLHSEGIIHRDLATRNILVSGTPCSLPTQVHMKISDFGLARVLDPNAEYYKSDSTKVIPAPWCAPESICNFQFRKEGDVWSFGITIWELFSFGDPPILCNIDEMANRLHRGDRLTRPKSCPMNVYQMMLKCWEYYPQNRITFPNIVQTISQMELL